MPDKLECQYDDCTEKFETHDERLEHSLAEHTDVNPKKYPNMTGQDDGLKF